MKQCIAILGICMALIGCDETATNNTLTPPAEALALVEAQPAAPAKTPQVMINEIRAKAGRAPIRRSAKLDAAARAHAQDMARNGFFSHTGSNGSTVAERITKAGYRWCSASENIAQGKKYNTATKVIRGWEKSRGHYRNMVNPKARAFGIAKKGDIWVQVFAGNNC